MPSVVPAPTTLGCGTSMDPQCRGWQIPFPRALCSPIFPDHFNMVTSSWASRGGTEVPAVISAVSTDLRTCCGGWGGKWEESPSVPSAHPCNAQRKQGNRRGRLVPAVIYGYPKIQGKPQWMLQNPSSGAKVLLFCFVLNSFICLLFVEGWEGVVCVCVVLFCSFLPLFFFC